MKILIIDNYDSFVFNIAQYVGEQNAEPVVFRNDAINIESIRQMRPDGIIISPGPGNPSTPRDIGICLDVILNMGSKLPILGICLGHQAIVHVFGGNIILADRIMHGKTSMIEHDEKNIFSSIKNPLKVMRYHSLIADSTTIPENLLVTAKTMDDQIIMGIQHNDYEIYGLQFHPESIGTEHGKDIIINFLEVCDDSQGH